MQHCVNYILQFTNATICNIYYCAGQLRVNFLGFILPEKIYVTFIVNGYFHYG